MVAERLRAMSDASDARSLANRLRSRRFARFVRLLPDWSGRVLSVLDIGGTTAFWQQRGWADRADVQITLVNLRSEPQRHDNIVSLVAHATDLREFPDSSFDVVFSNSTIEHLETLDDQTAMASEVRRLAPIYWVQTPNYWFPFEPHFQFPGWQWLPVEARVRLIQRYRFGRRGPYPARDEAEMSVNEVRLITRREMSGLFPDAVMIKERIGPFVKSYVAARGEIDGSGRGATAGA